MVAGGIGVANDNNPPRRTGTVTATRPFAATCFAFQLSGATATLQPTADGLVPDAAGSRLTRRSDVAEDSERCLGDGLPNPLTGQPMCCPPDIVLECWLGQLLADIRLPVTCPSCHSPRLLRRAEHQASVLGRHLHAFTGRRPVPESSGPPREDLLPLRRQPY
jgi:hypothetical protein